MFKTIHDDVQSVLDRDPAARSWLEVLLCYSGLHALWAYRLAHWFWLHKLHLPARAISQFTRWITGIEIHPGAKIGERFFIDHGMGVVIGETAEIGDCVTLYHGVTLGGTSLEKGKRHPTLENDVVVGAGAKVLGAITIGAGSRIGANAVVVKSAPPNSVVVGIPGQIVQRSQPRPETARLDFEHGRLPDTIGDTVTALVAHVAELEQRLGQLAPVQHSHTPAMHLPDHGVWHGQDFSI